MSKQGIPFGAPSAGPWHRDKEFGRTVRAADGHTVADCSYPVGWELGHANARLVAAAPELVEALKSIIEWTDTPSERIPIERREMLIRNAARAALAKALGEEG